MGCVIPTAVLLSPVEIQPFIHHKAQGSFETAALKHHSSQAQREAPNDTGLGSGFQSLVCAFCRPSSKLPKVTGEESIVEPPPPSHVGLENVPCRKPLPRIVNFTHQPHCSDHAEVKKTGVT